MYNIVGEAMIQLRDSGHKLSLNYAQLMNAIRESNDVTYICIAYIFHLVRDFIFHRANK